MDPAHLIDRHTPVEEKIRLFRSLFRSLFRGREDIYARRFESRKTGRSGYAPACANEWVRGICEKPRIKCAECPHRRFLPMTDEVIRWHLSGANAEGKPFVAGIYPLLADDSCWFVAIDFDKSGWREDASACLATCRHLDLPAALERSRSGNGAHLWLFFEEPLPASLVRRLASHVLTETMERRPQVGLDSYDRLFPNQDTMPQGGFGNLIALPLQKGPRAQANSIFLNEDLAPWPDQWSYLATVRKLAREQVEKTVEQAERRGRILGVRLPPQEEDDAEPWAAPPSRQRKESPIRGELPKTLELVLGNELYYRQGIPGGHLLGPQLSLKRQRERLAAAALVAKGCPNSQIPQSLLARETAYEPPRRSALGRAPGTRCAYPRPAS